MAGSVFDYWGRPAWIAAGAGAIALIVGVVGLTHALATIAPTPVASEALAIKADSRFSEASLRRFGDSMDPGALALAERYAPGFKVVLPQGAAAPTENSYENDPGPLPAGYQDLSHDQAAAANSKVPFSKAPNPAAEPFHLPAIDEASRTHALDCLTMAVYYEAASESGDGQAAVAQVVLNRLRNPLFPKTVCGVVFEGSKLSTGCQFSFTCDGSLARIPSKTGWTKAREVATKALNGYVQKAVGDATHYHAMYVVPYWQPSVVKLTQIGAHIFYRWPGGLGLPSAFRQQYAGVEEAPPAIPGFVGGDAGAKVVLAAANAPSAPPQPTAVVAPQAKPVELADLTLPAKAAPVVSEAVAAAPTARPKPSFFGQPSNGGGHAAISSRQ